MLKQLTAAAIVIGLVVGGWTATAQALPVNLVVNGGFEQGSFEGWTHTGNTGATFVESYTAHDGDYAAALGPVRSAGILSQLLNTVIGDTYEVSFWFLQPSAPPNLFSASFGGENLITLQNMKTKGTCAAWTEYLFEVTATSALSLLEFRFRDDPGYEYLDSVAVCDITPPPPEPDPVPEPGTMLLLGSGIMALAVYTKRRREG